MTAGRLPQQIPPLNFLVLNSNAMLFLTKSDINFKLISTIGDVDLHVQKRQQKWTNMTFWFSSKILRIGYIHLQFSTLCMLNITEWVFIVRGWGTLY